MSNRGSQVKVLLQEKFRSPEGLQFRQGLRIEDCAHALHGGTVVQVGSAVLDRAVPDQLELAGELSGWGTTLFSTMSTALVQLHLPDLKSVW